MLQTSTVILLISENQSEWKWLHRMPLDGIMLFAVSSVVMEGHRFHGHAQDTSVFSGQSKCAIAKSHELSLRLFVGYVGTPEE